MHTTESTTQPLAGDRPIVATLCGDPRFYDHLLDVAIEHLPTTVVAR